MEKINEYLDAEIAEIKDKVKMMEDRVCGWERLNEMFIAELGLDK